MDDDLFLWPTQRYDTPEKEFQAVYYKNAPYRWKKLDRFLLNFDENLKEKVLEWIKTSRFMFLIDKVFISQNDMKTLRWKIRDSRRILSEINDLKSNFLLSLPNSTKINFTDVEMNTISDVLDSEFDTSELEKTARWMGAPITQQVYDVLRWE